MLLASVKTLGGAAIATSLPVARAPLVGIGLRMSRNLKDVIHKFSTAFYNSVYSDPEDWFRDLFKGHPKEGAIQNQYEFLVQRFGGPAIYSGRKGPPMMRRRHAAFPCNEATAARWLHHMEKAFEEVPEIDSESRRHMAAFFTDFAQHLVEGQAESYGLGRHGTGASR